MSVFDNKDFDHHERVIYFDDPSVGLKSIIAVHNRHLGPALGGCRMYPYADEDAALTDVLRLSRGMTYKAAMAELNLGGGKAVVIGDPKKLANEKFFRAFGRFINSLDGRYITAEDVGTNMQSMEWISLETKHVTGLPKHKGGTGDPSPVTAHGIFFGIKAAVKYALNRDNVSGLRIAVQGAGNVGYALCKKLYEAEAKLFVSDIHEDALNRVVKEFGAKKVSSDDIYGLDVDVFSPCALGAIINEKTIPLFNCPIIAGSANNQLHDERKDGLALQNRGILYAPDYVINAGGLISVYERFINEGREWTMKKTEHIYDTLLNIFEASKKNSMPTQLAANEIAEKRFSHPS